MKKLLLVLTLILGFQYSFAECTNSGITFYPKKKEINRDAMFIIEGYAMTSKTIESFKNRKVYLQTKAGEVVELKLQEILYSQMNLVQAIFLPSKILKPNTTYFLKYENQTAKETDEMTSRDFDTNEPLYWITNNKKTSTQFSTPVSAIYKESTVEQYGCGPAVFARFDLKNDPNEKTWYRTELLEVATNITTVYYIRSFKNRLSIGHGMCSGAFSFRRKSTYKVRFTPVNSNGKKAKTTAWINFKSPFMEHEMLRGF